ncbi:hypothetical protein [Oricola sp.]|uniref:hypothetical protein n=1 Tax=Oricola sp. TaxID=1979950 RepID=UPI003BACD8BA
MSGHLIRSTLACVCLTIALSPHSVAAGPAKVLSCAVEDRNGILGAQLFQRLCFLAAEATGARLLPTPDRSDWPEETGQVLELRAQVVSSTAIAFVFARGTPQQWREGNEVRFHDLRVDIMDAELNEAALRQLARTVKTLAD